MRQTPGATLYELAPAAPPLPTAPVSLSGLIALLLNVVALASAPPVSAAPADNPRQDIAAAPGRPPALRPVAAQHVTVFHRPGVFAAWPANGGLWAWDNGQEALVGFRADKFGNADLGYPRLFQRADGRLVCVYYWSSEAGPEASIAATIWDPPPKNPGAAQ